MELKIDKEFKALIPPLTADEYRQLEENILIDGIRDDLITWDRIIVDGHNRYEIAQRHNLPYTILEIEFKDRQEAIEWIIKNQFGRRNLPIYEKARLALRLKPIIKDRARENQHLGINQHSLSQKSVEPSKKIDTQKELAREAGVSHDTIHKVEIIEEEAPEETKQKLSSGEISINKAYQEIRKPHVSNNSGNNEWYTPIEYLEIARKVMGSIDTDPASSERANKNVKATTFYTEEDNGLTREWLGNVWLNPPYAQPLIQQFADKLIKEIKKTNTKQAMVLVNNATETRWFNTLSEKAKAIWFMKGRVKFIDGDGNSTGAPLQGQAILYFGDNVETFISNCEGLVCRCSYE